MDRGFIEDGFIVDLTNAKNAANLIFELSRVLEMPEAKGKKICDRRFPAGYRHERGKRLSEVYGQTHVPHPAAQGRGGQADDLRHQKAEGNGPCIPCQLLSPPGKAVQR